MVQEVFFAADLLGPGIPVVSAAFPLSAIERGALDDAGVALPEDLRSAAQGRRDEYLAGRYCALEALRRAGFSGRASLAADGDRAPVWPAGFVGSIAHTRGMAAAAAAARSCGIVSVGLDLEPWMTEETSLRVRARVLRADEEGFVARDLADWPDSRRVTVAFSAKEAIYKCLRPVCGRFFGFEDARILRARLLGQEVGGVLRADFDFELMRELGGDFAVGWQGRGDILASDRFVVCGVKI